MRTRGIRGRARPSLQPRRTRLRTRTNESDLESARSGAHLHPHAAEGAARGADPARARPRRRGRARRPRPRAGPRRVDRRRPRRARRGQCQGQAQGRACSAPSRPTTSTVPPISASGSSARCARPRSTGSGWRRAAATSSTAPTGSRPRPGAGKVHLLIHAADAGEDGRKRLDQAWRVGGGRSRAGLDISRRTALSCRWPWGARMWYISP